jgi:hypothetical protein
LSDFLHFRLGPILLLLFSFSLPACQGDKDEKAIRETIEAMRTTAEKKSFSETMAAISSDYHDNLNQGHEDVERHLNSVFAPYERLAIKAPIQKIEKNGLSAVAFLKIVVIGVNGEMKDYLFGNPLIPKKVELYFDKRQGRWQVTGSRIER